MLHPYFAHFFPTNKRETARGLHKEKRYEHYYNSKQRPVNTKKEERASKYLQLNGKFGSHARLLEQFLISTFWEVDSSVKL